MDFNGNHEFAGSQSKVYAAFFDSNILAAAVPGCKEAKWVDPQTLELEVEITKIPGLNGIYEGQVKVTDQQEPSHFKLSVQRNSVQGTATIDLADAGGKTNLSYKFEASLQGAYKVADNIVGAQAVKMLLGQFFKQVEKQISG
ncbi:MAG TPA: SRPBCC domain-containing protein [Ktedonobacterales bacterium]